MAAKLLWPALDDPGKTGDKARHAQHVWCTPFEEVGIERGLGLAGGISAGSSLTPRTDLVPGAGADVERSCAGGPIEGLVTGKGQQIDGRLAEGDRHHTGR